MRRSRFALALIATTFAISACQDSGPVTPNFGAANAVSTASCTATLASLLDQAESIFGAPSPDYNSVRGKLTNLDKMLGGNAKQVERAKARAHDIVDFTLGLHEDGRLPASDAEVTAFVNAVYCFAGIDIVIGTPEDTWFIYPTDEPQILYGLDSTAAVSLPGFPVSEPSLLRIERFEGTLNTKLDQYPGFVRITLLSEGGTGLTGRATVSVCAVDVPETVDLADLRLGHGIQDTGFVITAQPTETDPTPATLACDTEDPELRLGQRVLRAVRSALAPQLLHARMQTATRRGGVSGTVTEFSPFAPVDTRLRSGGVSGTVTEFIRGPLPSASLMAESAIESVLPTVSCTERPVGSVLPPDCFPIVRITTRMGTPLAEVPVDWAVPAESPGQIAARSGDLSSLSCGTFGSIAETFTSLLGNAGVCWQLGGVGLNTVIATPRAGGEAPEGVIFDNEGEPNVVFEVAVTEAKLQKIAGNGQTASPGSTLPTDPKVRVVNAAGAPLAGVTVDWSIVAGSEGAAISSESTVSDSEGYARVQWTVSLGSNGLRAQIRNAPSAVVVFSATGQSEVVVGPPTVIEIVSGNGQTTLAGSATPIPPKVRVTDSNGVPIAGVTVYWEVRSGGGSTGSATSVTDSEGQASTSWTLGAGANRLKAYINKFVFVYVYFDATGTTLY